MRGSRYVFLIVLFLLINQASAQEPATLKVAHKIGEKLKADGWTYGSDASKKQIDCVQFTLRVLEEHYKEKFKPKIRTRILIADLKADDVINDKNGIISKSDPRTKGVQQALVSLKCGSVVPLAEAKPGDFIQYWMNGADGKWFGHSGIIEKVVVENNTRRAFLYGSHKSKNGIGTAPKVGLRLIKADDRRIYIVRTR